MGLCYKSSRIFDLSHLLHIDIDKMILKNMQIFMFFCGLYLLRLKLSIHTLIDMQKKALKKRYYLIYILFCVISL